MTTASVTTPRIMVLIPGYNVEPTIGSVLRRFSDQTLSRIAEIVVVDNDSTDGTAAAVKAAQDDSPLGRRLTLICNEHNYGLGGSLKIGFIYAIERGWTHVMIVHSDGQCDGEEIARSFFRQLDTDPDVDVVMTSRFMRGASVAGYNRARVAGNYFFNALTFVLTGCRMSDAGAGVILVRTSFLRRLKFLALSSSFFFNPQMNVLVYVARDIRIAEVPLTWTDAEVPSNLKALHYIIGLTKVLADYRLTGWNLDRVTDDQLRAEQARLAHRVLRAAPAESSGLPTELSRCQ